MEARRLTSAVLVVLGAFALVSRAGAELAQVSPFMPVGGAAQAAAGSEGPSGPIELRGIMPTGDGTAFCIYDTAKKKSVWVGINEAGHDFTVKSADPGNDSAVVDYQGRSMKLVLRTPKVASVTTGGAAGNPSITSTVAVNPTPADEQRRLDAVAQEVRRRRMEREKALVPAPGNLPPPGGR